MEAGQVLKIELQTSANLHFSGVWRWKEGKYIKRDASGSYTIPASERYALVVAGAKYNETGSYTLIVTATPGPLSIGAAAKLAIEHREEISPCESPQSELGLLQNYPNPFNLATEIRYQLPEASEVQIIIYDLLGQELRRLVEERKEVGTHSVVWDSRDGFGREVGSGVYVVRMVAKDFVGVRKMLLIR